MCTVYDVAMEIRGVMPGQKSVTDVIGALLKGVVVQVHHTLPQKYSDLFEGTGINIHDVENLRGVNVYTHRMITNIWGSWDRNLNYAHKKEDVIEFAHVIDKLFKIFWYKED